MVYNDAMKSLSVIIMFLTSLNLLACPFSIVEQDSKFFLILKRIGELPNESELIDQKLRRGLQEVNVKKNNKGESKIERRKVRIRVLYDSVDRDVLEKVLKTRCSSFEK
jgi:hypothetical protein